MWKYAAKEYSQIKEVKIKVGQNFMDIDFFLMLISPSIPTCWNQYYSVFKFMIYEYFKIKVWGKYMALTINYFNLRFHLLH